jgi:hypothetical protein
MKLEDGVRVLMVRHADWKSDAIGTIVGVPRQRMNSHGDWYDDYIVKFDEPQKDFTDEMNGDHDRSYTSSTVAAQFLRTLDCNDATNGHG